VAMPSLKPVSGTTVKQNERCEIISSWQNFLHISFFQVKGYDFFLHH